MLHPLGNRILVKPDPQPLQSDGGLVLLENQRYTPMSGEVVAVARGPATAHRIRAATIRKCLEIVDQTAERVPASALQVQLHRELGAFLMEQCQIPSVLEGDHVCFSYTAGHDVTVNGEDYILIKEDDLEAVWQPEAATVEAA